MNGSKYICPVCGENDQIQKVSAIISQQTKSVSGTEQRWSYDEGWESVPFHGIEKSELARKLAPLPEPIKSEIMFLGIIPVDLYSCWGKAFLIWGLFTYGTIAVVSAVSGIILILAGKIEGIVAFLFTLVFGGLFVWYRWRASDKKKHAEKRYAGEIIIWRTAMEKWERLYYCYRDDQVFDVENNYAFRPDFLNHYLTNDLDEGLTGSGS